MSNPSKALVWKTTLESYLSFDASHAVESVLWSSQHLWSFRFIEARHDYFFRSINTNMTPSSTCDELRCVYKHSNFPNCLTHIQANYLRQLLSRTRLRSHYQNSP